MADPTRAFGPSSPITARAAGALALAALACALAALILGEYEFKGLMPYGAGLLLGLLIGELVVEVGRTRSWIVGIVAGACVGLGLAWAAWRSVAEGLRPFPAAAWAAIAIGFFAAAWRCAPPRRR